MENGEWRIENCKLRMENGEWGMENEEWTMQNGELRIENCKLRMETITTLVLNTKKLLEIPRNSQKFQVYSQQDLEFLGIPTQRTNDFP